MFANRATTDPNAVHGFIFGKLGRKYIAKKEDKDEKISLKNEANA